jgi:outer membrane autotransporter protein
LLLDTVLNNGAPSYSDVLVVDQVTVGAGGLTRISVHNVGGAGGLTVGDGILVVEGLTNAATSSVPHAFRLGAPAVAGPYEYLLYRGGTGPGASDDWFLRNTFQPVPPEPEPNPEPPAPGPSIPRYRQEVSLYAAMPAAAAIYGRDIIDTLHERMGGDAQRLGPGENGTYDGTPDGVWGRLIGQWGRRDGPGIYIGGPTFDFGFGALQAGADLYRTERSDGSRDNAGLYAAFGHGQVDVEHNLLGLTFKAGTDDFDAASVGGYWTHFGPSDWYLDGVLQATWYQAKMGGNRGLRDGETDGWGLAASLEGGYPFHLKAGWVLEPQAQLVYQAIDLGSFNDGVSDVRYSDEDSLAGRVGLRLARSWDLEEVRNPATGAAPQTRQASLWFRGDLWDEFLDQPTTEFSSAHGFIPFTADLTGSWWKLGLGGTYDFKTNATFYGNVNYERTFDGDAYAWEGKLGLKVTW